VRRNKFSGETRNLADTTAYILGLRLVHGVRTTHKHLTLLILHPRHANTLRRLSRLPAHQPLLQRKSLMGLGRPVE